jgi:hypothetical protein
MRKPLSAWLLLAFATGASGCALGAPTAEPRTNAGVRADAEQVLCRERLHPGSNAHERVCMKQSEWAKLARREAREAERQVRVLQGSAYEGGSIN